MRWAVIQWAAGVQRKATRANVLMFAGATQGRALGNVGGYFRVVAHDAAAQIGGCSPWCHHVHRDVADLQFLGLVSVQHLNRAFYAD